MNDGTTRRNRRQQINDSDDGLVPPMPYLPWDDHPDSGPHLKRRAEKAMADGAPRDIFDWTEPPTPRSFRHNVYALDRWESERRAKRRSNVGVIKDGNDLKGRAWNRLHAIAGTLGGAREGERDTLLNWGAYTAGGFVNDGLLTREQVRDAMSDAAYACGLHTDRDYRRDPDRKIRDKVDRALDDSMANGKTVDWDDDYWRTMHYDSSVVTVSTEAVNELWSARPVLGHILVYARSRMVGPWGVLGALLARTVSQVPPEVQLPPIVGARMSLNMLVTLVGPSAAGKGGAEAVAREVIAFRHGTDRHRYAEEPDELPLGSGEGIARTLMSDEPRAVIFTAREIDSVAALFTRKGSTLEPELRKLYGGEPLGFTNAQKHTRTKVAAHSYRACLIAGAQPTRADFLLKAADAGTPQRFLWLPVDDPQAPDEPPHNPGPRIVAVPAMFGSDANMVNADVAEIAVPDPIREQIREHRLSVLRSDPSVDPLDGHRMLCRLKVAAALMVLDGRHAVDDDDWRLAGLVMAASDRTRAAVGRASAEKRRRANQAKAHAEIEREQVHSDSKQKRACEQIVRTLKSGFGGVVPRNDLRRSLRYEIREYFDSAVLELTNENVIRRVAVKGGDGFELC